MARCLIIGGGLAGLSSAVYLSRSGHDVELIESSPKFGGRTYSFYDHKTNSEIDNGQHIFMGAYHNTFEFLKLLESDHLPKYAPTLSSKFINKQSRYFSLIAPNKFYPINLFQAILDYNILSLKEKFNVLLFLGSLFINLDKKPVEKDVESWLKLNNQTINTINSLWEVIGVGALNTHLREADYKSFRFLLKEIFFSGNNSATIVLPKVPLSKLFNEPAENYFKANNIKYALSEKLVKIESDKNKIKRIITDKRILDEFDNLILALPPHSLEKIISKEKFININTDKFEYSPIITIHLWLSEEIIAEDFIGLLNSKIHWIFKNKDHFSLVISASDELIEKTPEEIAEEVITELTQYFPKFNSNILHEYKILKEKRATIKSTRENNDLRKGINSNYENVFFAGDWTNTNLPATIEGAILSGKKIGSQII